MSAGYGVQIVSDGMGEISLVVDGEVIALGREESHRDYFNFRAHVLGVERARAARVEELLGADVPCEYCNDGADWRTCTHR